MCDFRLAAGRPFDLRDKIQVGVDGHLVIEGRVLGQVSDALPDFQALLEDVVPGHPGRAFGRRHVAGEDAHGRRLPGTVGPEKPEDLALLHLEGDIVDCLSSVVHLREMLYFDHAETLPG